MFFRHGIGEAIAEIERGWVHASSPARISIADPPRCSRRHGNDSGSKPVQEARDLRADGSPRRNDQRFGKGTRGNQHFVFRFESGETGLGLQLFKHDRHQSRGIDGDHFGRPSSS